MTSVRFTPTGTGPASSGYAASQAAVDLYWLPLGAGRSVVRFNGRLYEWLQASFQRRRRLDLYHSALAVRVPDGRFVIELAPVPDGDGAARGVVCEGPVGHRWLGCLRLFRYELRCWPDGAIPDIAEAVASPQRLTDIPRRCAGCSGCCGRYRC